MTANDSNNQSQIEQLDFIWRDRLRGGLEFFSEDLFAVLLHFFEDFREYQTKQTHSIFRTFSSLNPASLLIQGMAREVGLEPTTCGLENRCSIQLSYSRNVIKADFYA